ncbi:hypothetical protein M0P65_06955 [Candidatus Gracilibacteria bacterium]|jgi:hypothetical protein|nr:hypothetical protein [Candidatus Gracilibacteria bacterium]
MKNDKDWYGILTGFIFVCLVFTSKLLCKIFWSGCKFIWRNKKSRLMVALLSIIIGATIYFILKYDTNDSRQALCLLPIPSFLFATGIINKILNAYLNEYSKIFESINFKDKSGQFPKIIKKVKSKKDKKIREIFIIKSMIPFSEWNKNNDLLESAFNAKIALKKTEDRQIIKLIKLGV